LAPGPNLKLASCCLRARTKPAFSAHLDTGDLLIHCQADKIAHQVATGRQKIYRRHSEASGMKTETFAALGPLPEGIVEKGSRACSHNALGRQLFPQELKGLQGN